MTDGTARGRRTGIHRPDTSRSPPITPRWSMASLDLRKPPETASGSTTREGVTDAMLDHFWDVDNGGLFSIADDAEQLVARQKDLMDNATPSANSTAAVALLRLGALTGEVRYANHAEQILRLLGRVMPQAPSAFSNALVAVDLAGRGITEIAIVGDRLDLVRAVRTRWLPNSVLAWGKPYESPLWKDRADGFAYVCRHYVCQLPVDSVEALVAQLGD